jgi:acetyl esterase/lipase
MNKVTGKQIIIGLGLGLTTLVATPATAKPTPPTIEQLAAFAKFSSFNVSQDGKHLVALQAFGEEQHILVWETDNLSAKPTEFGSKGMKIRSVQFIKNDVLGVSLWQPYDSRLSDDVIKTFTSKLMMVNLDGSNWREPVDHGRALSDIEERLQALSNPDFLSSLPDDPDNVLLITDDGFAPGDIYKVNVHNGATTRVMRTDAKSGSYIADRAGNIRVRHKLVEDNQGAYVAIEIRDLKSGLWSEVSKSYVRERDTFDIVGFTEDPNIAVAASNVGTDKVGLFEYDMTEHKLGAPIFQHAMFDATNTVNFAFKGSKVAVPGEIVGVSYEGPTGGDVIWTNPTFQQLDTQIRALFGIKKTPLRLVDTATGKETTSNYDAEKFYHIVSYSADLTKIVIRLEGHATPPEYYIINNGRPSLLAKQYPDIDPASLGTTKFVYYKARDGLNVPAFLTTPSVELCGAGPWKAVVHPHGGPWGRDSMPYDWSQWVNLMSTRCMAVLRPQYRGSYGWGKALWKAGDAEWGQKMQDDKDDGAKWMIEQKVAQPNHIAMFGFSYGGYAAMAAAIRPNGLYKCAIAGAGVSDIKRIWRAYYDNPYFRDHQKDTVKGLNPVEFADKIQIPVMVFQGMRDRTVPPEQSQWYVEKARKSGQPVEYHEVADFAHGPAWTRKIEADTLHYIEDYLTKGCGGGGL